MEPLTCYLSLGANLGDRLETLRRAIELLDHTDNIHVAAVSSMYDTPPWGKLDQPAFINCAMRLEAAMSPLELLARCQAIEAQLGRVRHEHWGARTIDIDILYIPGVEMAAEKLTLPHPYMLERAFVLIPLRDVAPELVLEGLTVAERCEALPDRETIRRIE